MAYGYNPGFQQPGMPGFQPGAPGYVQPAAPGYMPPSAPMPDQLAQLRAQQAMAQQTAQPQPAQPGATGINWVQGEAGAKSFLVAPGNSVMLMDAEGQVFYIKGADPSGMPLPLRIFDYTERPQPGGVTPPAAQAPQSAQDYVTRAEFDALTARIDALSAPRTRRQAAAKEEAEEHA